MMSDQEIHDLCEKYDIKDYSINPDGSIDVNEDVNLAGYTLGKLPLKFNYIRGSFYCNSCSLTNLIGCPKIVGKSFYCRNNKLTSLQNSPEIIYGRYYFKDNPLKTLDGFYGDYSKLSCDNRDILILKHKRKQKLKIIDKL